MWKPPNDIDPECVKLCRAINAVEGLHTTESCCGHSKYPFRIWFHASYVKALYPLVRLIDRRYGGVVPEWVCAAEDTDTEIEGQPGSGGVVFRLESPDVGTTAYQEADHLASRIHDFFVFAQTYRHDFGVRKIGP